MFIAIILFILGVIYLIIGILTYKYYLNIPEDKIWLHSYVTNKTIYYKDYFRDNYVIHPVAIGLIALALSILLIFNHT